MKNPKIITISAKCSDMFSALLVGIDQNGKPIEKKYSGYVPDFMPGEHYGDYVELTIDLATGQIIGWTPPTAKQLNETFGKN